MVIYDIRGFESSKKVANVQMQLQKGTIANHGKANTCVFFDYNTIKWFESQNTAKKLEKNFLVTYQYQVVQIINLLIINFLIDMLLTEEVDSHKKL